MNILKTIKHLWKEEMEFMNLMDEIHTPDPFINQL